MHTMWLASRWLAFVLMVATMPATSSLRAQQRDAPITMGSLVMMGVSGHPESIGRIAASLVHPEPGMRVVAARLVAVGRITALRAPLAEALRVESNEVVAAHQTRALMLLGVDAATPVLDPWLAGGAPPPAIVAYGLELARHTPQLFVERLPRLVSAMGAERAARLVPAVQLLAGQHPAAAERAWQAWLQHAPGDTWAAVLPRHGVLSDSVLIEALAWPDPVVREASVWHVVNWIERSVPVPATVVEAAQREVAESPAWEAFGRELLRRRFSSAPREDRSALITAQPPAKRDNLRAITGSASLMSREQSALNRILGDQRAPLPPGLPGRGETPALMRTAEILWPGYVTSLMSEARCLPGLWAFGAVRVKFAPDGRPVELTVDRGDLTDECVRYATALAQLTLADPDKYLPVDASQWVVASSARDHAACVDAPRPDLGLAQPPGGTQGADIRPPRKTRDVKPRYPPDALDRNVRGTVILEAVISREGCMSAASTLRSLDPFLAMEAMRAVLQWRYSAAEMNGRPVDVIMTVTVNFTLNMGR